METKKRTGGFTLIELIVVIAILGILAGVGTVAYTGYIKAANKGVDEKLISDVAYSMYLAGYADPNFLEGDAYVVGLKYGADPELKAVGADEGTTGEAKLQNALEMSFGSGCTANGTLELRYDGWKLGAVTGVLSYVGSSFDGNAEKLLGDIQTFTDSLNTFLGENGGDRLNQVLNSENSEYAKYLKSMNAATSQEVANATTLYLAQYAANKSDPEEYAQWWASGLEGTEEYVPSELWESAQKFNDPDDIDVYDATGDIMMFYAAKVAAAEASYQYVTKQEGEDTVLTEKFNAVRNANGLSSLMQAVTDFNLAIKKKPSYSDWCANQAAQDAKAYIQCLSAIDESSDSFAGNLSQQGGQDTGLYTDGKALSMVTSYVSTAQAVNAMGLDENSAAVAITVCKDSSGKIIVTVYKNGEATALTGDGTGDGGEDGPQIPEGDQNVTWSSITLDDEGYFTGTATPSNVNLSVGQTLVISGQVSYSALKDSIMMMYGTTNWQDVVDAGVAEGVNSDDTSIIIVNLGDTAQISFNTESNFIEGPIQYNASSEMATIVIQTQFSASGTYTCVIGPTNLVVTVD